MKSTKPKVLHQVAALPMVTHVVRTARSTPDVDVAVVVGRQADEVRKAVEPFAPGARMHMQTERLGTAHAVLAARETIERGYDDILVMFGDTPLIEAEAVAALRAGLAGGASVVVMGFRPPDPTGYGRLIERDGHVVAIREHKDASEEERRIGLCNGGVMAIAGTHALQLLEAVGNDNAKGEFYLTDIVALAVAHGLTVKATEVSADDVIGVNTRAELATVEAIWQQRRRRELMLAGVSMPAPETVFIAFDTDIEADVIVEQNVVFGPGVKVRSGARVRSFSHLEGATVSEGAEIGPFARLRPGTVVGGHARVGNFCEVKNAVLDDGAKVNHLTYIGDARIGAKANIGAGTITCNYDGFGKHRTEIGAGAFIGSNSSLVAPVSVGDGAYVASGSVITESVPADALAFGRARQVTKPDMGRRLRDKRAQTAGKSP